MFVLLCGISNPHTKSEHQTFACLVFKWLGIQMVGTGLLSASRVHPGQCASHLEEDPAT